MIKKSLMMLFFLGTMILLSSCDPIISGPTYDYTIDEIAAAITIDYADGDQANYVTSNLGFPTTSQLDSSAEISWMSYNPTAITNDGIVTRGDSDQDVTLMYTLSYADEITFGYIYVTVIGLNESSMYKITFDSQGGSAVDPIIAAEGDTITAPENPTRADYEFAGWYSTTNYLRQFTFNTMPSGNITLYAKWNYIDTNVYTITFDSNGGSAVSQIAAHGGVSITEPSDPTKDGYTFLGWFSDQALTQSFTFNYMPYESIVVYAKWIEESTYTGYYSSVSGLFGDDLYNQLHTIINNGFHGVTYGDARYMLDDTDVDPTNSSNLILVYKGTSVSGYWDGGATWNREHVWPQSLLGVSADNNTVNQASDLQNLKPANPNENSSRGNKWYANTTTSYSYAPRNAVKGDIARILLYMDLMYANLHLINISSGDPNVYQMGDLATLLQWAANDPVDAFEQNRNNLIYEYQGNRNPFIDHPEFIDYIYNS
ncbi:MAG: InlB B-repeat-containing protein [Acholeplasmataceae bacterium]